MKIVTFYVHIIYKKFKVNKHTSFIKYFQFGITNYKNCSIIIGAMYLTVQY